MICVDTSVWVAFLRRQDFPDGDHLSHLLEDAGAATAIPVRLEILAGADPATLKRLDQGFSAVPTFHPSGQTWTTMEKWIATAVKSGQRFGVVDLLIAAIAAEHQQELWSLDRDFEWMEKMGFVKLHRPPRG